MMTTTTRAPGVQHTRKAGLPLLSVLLTLTGFAISGNAIPPLATTMAEHFAVPFEAFGYIFMLQFLCFSCASWTGGYVQHRFGIPSRWIVITGILGVAFFLMAGSLLGGFVWVVAWIIPLGFAGGLTETFSSLMMAESQQGDSSRLMNLSQVFFCIGAIIAPQAVAFLLDRQIAWRAAFLLFGLFVLVIGVLFILGSRSFQPTEVNGAQSAKAAPEQTSLPLSRDPLFYLMSSLMFVYVVVELSCGSWIAAYFEKQYQLPVSEAARALSLLWIGVIIGRSLMVVLPAKFTLWPGLIGGACGMVIGSALLAFSSTATTATGAVLLFGIASGPVWPVTVMICQRLRESGRFTSAVIGVGGLGAALGPLFGAYIIRSLGLGWFFPLLVLGSLLLSLCAMVVKYRVAMQGRGDF